jgi:hypothetical protein
MLVSRLHHQDLDARIIACGMPEHVINELWVKGTVSGSFTQKQPYVIDKGMEQFRQFILSISNGTYDKSKKQFHYLTD